MAGRMHRVTIMVLIASVLALTEMNFANLAYGQQTKDPYETTGEAPLRDGPGNFHKIVTTLPKGIKINVMSKGSRIGVFYF